ncbi:MAG: ATP-dependent Clp protease proteolytic subunit [Lachnospiraceae bacterium]|nr:ATP-dependent Clp protease proteolytic subunit [Lachnospiraceae bacterium]
MSYEARRIIRETANGSCTFDIQDHLLKERNVYLNGEVNSDTALDLLHQFMYLEKENSEDPINFFINSPGGSVSDGMIVYDYLRMMTSPVRTICTGRACSMGAILFLASDVRLMFPGSELMIHDASFANANFSGLKPNEIEERTKDLVKTCKMLRGIVADRTGKRLEVVTKTMKKDSSFNAKEAIKFRLATGIVKSAAELFIETDDLR